MESKISNSQLFSIIFFVIFGTTVIYGYGSETKQDTWIVLVISCLLTLVFYLIYVYFLTSYPGKRLTQILSIVFGKWIGKILILLYGIYFLYIASFNLSDISHILNVHLLEKTPSIAIIILLESVALYGLILGVEVMSRASKTALKFTLVSITIIILSVFGDVLSKPILTQNPFTPVLEYGWGPIINDVSKTIAFPYGELVVITMFYSLVKDNKKSIKVIYASIIIVTILMLIPTMASIYVSGTESYNVDTFKFFSLLAGIDAPVLERIDSIGVSIVILGAYFKHMIMLYAGIVAIKDFFSLKSYKILLLPLIIIVSTISYIMTTMIQYNLHIGLNIVPYYVHYPMQFGIPIIIMIATFIKKRSKKPAIK